MDKDRIKGKMKQLGGKVQRTKGNLTDSNSDKIAGTAKEIEGNIEEEFGKTKDAVRKVTKKP
jgi:uncharacterized protein YjbJ (UPF0337 family)